MLADTYASLLRIDGDLCRLASLGLTRAGGSAGTWPAIVLSKRFG